MKKLTHLALAAALMASSVSVAATSASAAEKPWLIVTYVSNGYPVGNTQAFCDGSEITTGNTINYDNIVRTYYYMCP